VDGAAGGSVDAACEFKRQDIDGCGISGMHRF
jgi:hypothetical protein